MEEIATRLDGNQVIAQVAERIAGIVTENRWGGAPILQLRRPRTESDDRIDVRLATYAAIHVLHLVPALTRLACVQTVHEIQAWLVDPSATNRDRVLEWANYLGRLSGDSATYATCGAAYSVIDVDATGDINNAANYATLTALEAVAALRDAGGSDADLLNFFNGLLNAWDEAAAAEGEER
jgi:hypothetical protein